MAKLVSKKSSLEDETEKPQKKGLLNFLRRKKKTVNVKDDNEEPKKRTFPGFLKRFKIIRHDQANTEKADIENVTPATDVDKTNIEDQPKKSGIFTRKMLVILLSLLGLTGASGAAAIVFAGPLLLGNDRENLACDVVLETSFELMKERRITSYIRADILPPKERILMIIEYTHYLATKHPDTHLVSVSLLDINGPTERPYFRGSNIGAQAIFSPDPLLTQATKRNWEVRYVNADHAYAGQFIGDRYELSPQDIAMLRTEILEPSGCRIPEIELVEAKMIEENTEENSKVDVINKTISDLGDTGEQDKREENAKAYPDDKNLTANMIVKSEDGPKKEQGFFSTMLSMVGLGDGDDEMVEKEQKSDVLGKKIQYN